MYDNEIWLPVNWANRYLVSNYGRVKSLKNNKEVYLAQKDQQGYKRVGFSVNGKQYHPFVHRLVGEAFIPNIENKPTINHIDGNKSNNYVSNLEWSTMKEQCIHRTLIGEKKKCGTTVEVIMLDKDSGEEIRRFDSVTEAAIFIAPHAQPRSVVSMISDVSKGNRISIYGYKWKYVTKELQQDGEVWREFEGSCGEPYYVSNFGRVKRNNKILKGVTVNDGYITVTYQTDIGNKTCYLHKIVAKLFIPNPHNYKSVTHLDKNISNNRADNLKWTNNKKDCQ